jgi:hypothetical protein
MVVASDQDHDHDVANVIEQQLNPIIKFQLLNQ